MQVDKDLREFDAIYQMYHDDIYRFLMKLSNYNPYLAEELTQETFYMVYLGIGSFKGQCHIKSWMCQIAKNSFFLYLRKNRKIDSRNTFSSAFDKEDTYDKASVLSTEDAYENREAVGIIIKIIDSFKELNRNVMIYRIFLNMPYSEISKLLGISEASAKVIYHRGRIILQNKLREEYGYEI